MHGMNRSLTWKLGIAGCSLLAAIAVYCLARPYPPELLEPFRATLPVLAARTGLFGSAPALFYTLAIGLLVAACASTPKRARWHCLLWIAIALSLELSQHPFLAEPVASWLANAVSAPAADIVRSYWVRGTFDLLDLLATLAGGLTALLLLGRLPVEKNRALD